MVSPEVSKRHRALMAELVTVWRRRAALAPQEPPVPYDDDDEVPDDRERVIAEVLGRFVESLGKINLSSCGTPADVDRLLGRSVREDVLADTRPGSREAARIVLGLLNVPISLPEPDAPSSGESPA